MTDEDKKCVQVVILPRVTPVKLSRFPTVHGKEVGARVIGPQRIEEFFEGRVETMM